MPSILWLEGCVYFGALAFVLHFLNTSASMVSNITSTRKSGYDITLQASLDQSLRYP